jgi:hypothetical protein
MFQIQNNSAEDVGPIIDILNQFIPFSQKRLGFHKPVNLFLQSDEENANKILGKTAFYNPEEFSVTVFTSGRHPKDIMRSLSHELVHHAQNCRGDLGGDHIAGEGYAQKDPHMRNMELEAYEKGNIIFRDFEDLIKADEININLSGEPRMSLKEWRDNELNTLLMEKWGYRKEDDKSKEEEEDVQVALKREQVVSRPRTDVDAGGLRPGGGGDAAASVGPLGSAGAGKGGALPPKKKVDLKPPKLPVSEGCPDLEGDELEIDIIGPGMGMEAEAPDLSDLTPDEAYGAGWAAAAQAIEDALASGPEEAIEAGDEMGEEEEEELMEQDLTVHGFPRGMKSTSEKDVMAAAKDISGAAQKKDAASGVTRFKDSAASTAAQQIGGLISATGAINRTKARRENIDLAEAKKAAKQLFIRLLKENGDDDDSADDDMAPDETGGKAVTDDEGEPLDPADIFKKKGGKKKGEKAKGAPKGAVVGAAAGSAAAAVGKAVKKVVKEQLPSPAAELTKPKLGAGAGAPVPPVSPDALGTATSPASTPTTPTMPPPTATPRKEDDGTPRKISVKEANIIAKRVYEKIMIMKEAATKKRR